MIITVTVTLMNLMEFLVILYLISFVGLRLLAHWHKRKLEREAIWKTLKQ